MTRPAEFGERVAPLVPPGEVIVVADTAGNMDGAMKGPAYMWTWLARRHGFAFQRFRSRRRRDESNPREDFLMSVSPTQPSLFGSPSPYRCGEQPIARTSDPQASHKAAARQKASGKINAGLKSSSASCAGPLGH